MSSSLRARRMARNHRRLSQTPRLNLVALMDIFTILVLFLMVNNGDVEVLQPERNITLPESVSEQKPELALTIKVSAGDVILQGRKVASVSEALAQSDDMLASLEEELRYQASRAPQLTEAEQLTGRPIIIMGDESMPYKLLKRIMATCAGSDYRDIALAVNSVPPVASTETQIAATGAGI